MSWRSWRCANWGSTTAYADFVNLFVVYWPVLIIYEWQNVIYFGRSMLLPLKWQVEISIKFDTYLQDLRLIPTKRLLYLIGFAANTGNSSRSHTFNEWAYTRGRFITIYREIAQYHYCLWHQLLLFPSFFCSNVLLYTEKRNPMLSRLLL